MVLSDEYVRKNFKEIQEKSYNYLFLNVKSLNGQIETIERTIKVLGLINEVNRIKQLCKDLNSEIELDESILYEVIKAIYENVSFTDEKLKKYVQLKCTLCEIHDSMYSFVDINCSLCSLTEYYLFGLSFEDQEKLSNENTFKLEEEYNNAFYDNYKKLCSENIFMKLKDIVFKYKSVNLKKSA